MEVLGDIMSKDREDKNVRITSRKPKTDNFKKRAERLKAQPHLNKRSAVMWSVDLDMVHTPFQRVDADLNIQTLIDFLKDSATARTMLFTRHEDLRTEIAFDDQTIVSQFYPEQNTITLNPDRPVAELACVLVKEMRRAYQFQSGNLHNPMNFAPDDAILINRAQQADALMMAIRVAWELKLLGQNQMWEFMTAAPFSDVTRTFEIHAQNDFRTLNDGRASRAAYDKWFDDHRTKIHDKRVIHQMLLEDTRYAEQRRDQITPLTEQMLFNMASVPGGKNYMSLKGHRAPMHAEYMDVEDRSNANFLWFVKFERNFQEKETEMMMEESLALSAEVIDFSRRAMELRQR